MKESPDQSVRVFLFEEVFFNAENAENAENGEDGGTTNSCCEPTAEIALSLSFNLFSAASALSASLR